MKPKITLNDLPADKLPEFWNDNARLNALYAPLRDRSVNARDWNSKLDFWKGLITTWCDYNKICTFSETELKQCFIQNNRSPACLSVILNEMYRNGELQTLDQFMVSPQKTWAGWVVDMAFKKPISWSFNKVKNTLVSPINANTVFIHLASVQKQSENLFLAVSEEHRNKLLTIDELISICNLQNVDLPTIKLLLHNLQCQGKIDTCQNNNEENESAQKNSLLIKISDVNSKVVPISGIDIGKHTLEQNEMVLIKKIEELEKEKALATNNTKSYLAKGMRQMAKTCLRKQHEFEKRIEKQVSVLDNVQTLLGRIGTAESDGQVLESYRHGLNTLKSVFKDTGLTEDSATNTMVELEEVLECHDDIQSTISQSFNATLDAELEEELAELLAESPDETPPKPPSPGVKSDEEDELTRRLIALKMPVIPPDSPSSSPIKTYQSPSQ